MMNSFCTLLLSTVYIFNVAQGKYLTIDSDGNATLSATPVAVELSPTDDGTGRFNQDVRTAQTPRYAIDSRKLYE